MDFALTKESLIRSIDYHTKETRRHMYVSVNGIIIGSGDGL